MIKSSLARLPDAEQTALMSVIREFPRYAAGITGYAIPNVVDRLGLLQHYVGRSPVVDLTGTPNVALYFALLGAAPKMKCVVYALDRTALSEDIMIADHQFLVLPLSEGGVRHRWLRQDGFAICPREWQNLNVVNAFDLRMLPGLQEFCFDVQLGDGGYQEEMGDLLSLSGDPLAARIKTVLLLLLRELGLDRHSISRFVRDVSPTDAEASLLAEIDTAIEHAQALGPGAESILAGFLDCRHIATHAGGYWDTSWDCKLDALKRQLDRAQP
jgi:FRG domain